jgi:hypothetical protein
MFSQEFKKKSKKTFTRTTLPFINHFVAVKKLDSHTWEFYGCNLEPPQRYETLNLRIEKTLEVYFYPENVHTALGAPYSIEAVRKVSSPRRYPLRIKDCAPQNHLL